MLETERLRARKDNFGLSLSAMTPARIAEAAEAFNLLDDSPLSLLEAVRIALHLHKTKTASIPFLDLFNQFLESKSDRSPAYIKELATRDRFSQLHRRLVCDITPGQLEALVRPLSPAARNFTLRYWRAVFNYGIRRGFLAENPIKRLDFAKLERREVETVSNQYVRGMLEHALTEDLELLPFLVFGFFCGIRPDGELQKLDWSDIHLADRTVVIRSEVSKTRRRRFPELSENAAAWLGAYQQRGGQIVGKVVSITDSELRSRRKANQIAAGLERWIQQGMRHTFCSNWLALHKDVNKLVLMSGHDSVDTMWRRYFKGTTEADAKAFWEIRPPQEDSKLIAFHT
jgi:integrase